ncbi:hypothetical protein Sjap_002611 [Stephania japonica]|uniref:Uncharacterized protein n=1 Tax=Stephania japonica TaxID=461633 RepID=A0AAP0KME3_9MAGN
MAKFASSLFSFFCISVLASVPTIETDTTHSSPPFSSSSSSPSWPSSSSCQSPSTKCRSKVKKTKEKIKPKHEKTNKVQKQSPQRPSIDEAVIYCNQSWKGTLSSTAINRGKGKITDGGLRGQ